MGPGESGRGKFLMTSFNTRWTLMKNLLTVDKFM